MNNRQRSRPPKLRTISFKPDASAGPRESVLIGKAIPDLLRDELLCEVFASTSSRIATGIWR